jgi:iron complex outermembrane receptor protein
MRRDFTPKVNLMAALLATTMLSAYSAAFAQETEPNEGEIVVTAQKRDQRLQDVGLSINAFQGETVTELGVKDVASLGAMVAGLSANAQAGEGNQPLIFLRGVGLNDFSENNSSPIAIYIDDVYVSSQAAQTVGLFDLERVEVLKGPQGTLYGRNATGGAIRFITQRPEDTFSASGRISYANFGALRAEGVLNAPLTETSAFRLSLLRNEGEGFMENRLTGDPLGGHGVTAFRAALDAQLPAGVSAEVTLFGDITKSPGVAYRFRGVLDPITLAPCPASRVQAGGCANFLGYRGQADRFEGAYDNSGGAERETFGGAFELNGDWAGSSLTSVTSFITTDSQVRADTDASPQSVLHLSFDVASDTFTQELRAAWTGERYDLVVGAYYLDETLDQDQTGDVFRAFRPVAAAINPVAFPGGFDPLGAAVGAPIFFARTVNMQETQAVALFGQYEFDVTDHLRVIGGLRYSSEDRTFDTASRFEEPTFTAPLFSRRLDISDENVSGRIGVEYKPSDDILIFGNASTGFKSGGFNGGFILDAAQVVPYQPETLTAYEIGTKTDWFDGRLRLNASAFVYDYQDMQLFTLINSGGVPTSVLTNAGAADIRGLELETVLRPIDGLTLSANAAFLSSELTEFITASAFGAQDFTGNELPRTPEVSFAGQASYTRSLGAIGDLNLLAAARHQGDVFFDTSNNPLFAEDATWTVDLRAALIAPNDRWEIALFGRNVFDEDYNVGTIDLSAFGFFNEIPAPPRQVGVELALRY